ncbi:MAG: hypothetical protein KAJ51_14175 [Thermoplasmata archaeon]|nr:hypothetical protein [Thermoplasmata archaeon]
MPPIDNAKKAESYTFNLQEVKRFFHKSRYPIAKSIVHNSNKAFTVFWYPLEMVILDRIFALRIDVDIDGKYTVKRTFFTKEDRV